MKTRGKKVFRGSQWVVPYLRRYRRALLLALALGAATIAFSIGLMASAGYLIAGSAVVETVLLLNLPLMLVRLFGVGKPLLSYFERLASHDWVLRMVSGMRLGLYRSLSRILGPQSSQEMGPNAGEAARASVRAGDALGLLADDIGELQNLYLRVAFPCILAWAASLVAVLAMGALDVWMACILAASFAAVVLVAPLVSFLACRAGEERRRARRRALYAELTDDMLGAADWAYSGRGADRALRDAACVDELKKEQASADRFGRVRAVVVQVLCGAVVVALIVWAAARFGGGAQDAKFVAAFALGAFPLLEAFAPVPQAGTDLLGYRDSLRRLDGLPVDTGDAGAAGAAGAAARPSSASSAFAPSDTLDIVFDDVVFSRDPSQRELLSGLDLRISQGTHIAVLGRSGAGKTTMLELIRGLVRPQVGRVTIGGADPSRDAQAATHLIGVVEQMPYLFNASILENLRIAKPEVSRKEAASALSAVGLGDFLAGLDQGLDTQAQEAGGRFSGGQRQRIALARILLRDTPIVLLDEPFVGLDPASEAALIDTLFEVFADRTIVMVTHHLQGVHRMDRVVFLEDGRAKLSGSPSELERTSAYYCKLLALDEAKDR